MLSIRIISDKNLIFLDETEFNLHLSKHYYNNYTSGLCYIYKDIDLKNAFYNDVLIGEKVKNYDARDDSNNDV